ncbi:50S ribosomal protein L13 [Candidatus Methylacidiphilum infernorum]|uniref:Large ribosomal subunit protein uL13 n=1 Tax=Methylacidiphilum infernorum (isolate V4) TaxID=481448 RepID=RL13_METI4|nr:50S ribosomal protein L13 [Candidatus Methylacidiphilum infernorum]B3E0U2.1 RecName: Full=Large ribosomal subunit protein uL13; AltName: Full=50S ribosomal protein L13 [Methylacidiphilum infernorum V4]ACD84419.1 Ribosomal protein L13 [Methylacidiphilum infernorum V4]
MKTYFQKPQEVQRKWYIIDARDKIVGKVAEKVACLLRGKHKEVFSPHVDTGDHVIVINASKAIFSGKKETQKLYSAYSGYIGGQKTFSPVQIRQKRPNFIIEHAVRGMIPHNRLGRKIYTKLHVYEGSDHPHAAQKPIPVTLD